jgi:hypothetical protein
MQEIIAAVKQRLKEVLGDFGELDLAAEGIVADALLGVVAEIKGKVLSNEEEKAFTPEDWAKHFDIETISTEEFRDRLFARIAAEFDKLLGELKASLEPMESRVLEMQINKVKNKSIVSQLGGDSDLKIIAGEA